MVVVVAAGVIAGITLSGNDDGGSSVEGSVGTEGGYRFEVRSTECGLSSLNVSTGASATPENGTFCQVRIGVENLGEAPGRLDPSCQYMFDAEGTRHVPREDIAALRDVSGGLFQEGLGPYEVTPPNTAVFYDVALDTKVAAVEFHSSCNSEGVRIELLA